MSTFPGFNGGIQAGSRDDRDGYRRETIDPDDFGGGFGLWSGTSFAAPYLAGLLARDLSKPLMTGSLPSEPERIKALRAAERNALKVLHEKGPTPA